MEPLILPLIELLRGVSNVANGGLIGLALIVVGYTGAVFVRRWAHGPLAYAGVDEPLRREHPGGVSSRHPPLTTRNPTRDKVNGKMAVLRIALRGLGMAGVFFSGSLLLVENYGTEPILKWSLGNLEARTGINLTFGRATGGLLSGRLSLRQVRVVRENHPESNFDLACSEMTIRFSLLDILFQRLRLQDLRVDQISGSYHRLSSAHHDPSDVLTAPNLTLTARNIPVGHLQLNDATIDFTDGSVDGEPVRFTLAVKTLNCAPFRTAFAPYDVVFRSTVEGTIDQHPFQVQTEQTELGPKTQWRVTGLPIRLVGGYLGGPFRWLREGDCQIHVVQQMRESPRGPVTVDAHLILRNIKPGVPGDIKPAVAIAAQLLMTQLKTLPKERELKFTLQLDPDKFDLTTTESANQLWRQFKTAAIASLLQASGLSVELPDMAQQKLDNAVDNVAQKALQVIENIRERRKAKKEEKRKPPAPKNP